MIIFFRLWVVLIAFDRFFAVVMPIWYKNVKTFNFYICNFISKIIKVKNIFQEWSHKPLKIAILILIILTFLFNGAIIYAFIRDGGQGIIERLPAIDPRQVYFIEI